MRAVVIDGPGALRVGEVPDPVPGAGEVVIRTLSAAICNATDVHIWEGRLGEDLRPAFPHVLGHERSGVVVAVGPGVEGIAVGDRVACWAKMDGAFAEYDVLRPNDYPMVVLGEGVSDDAGALLEFVGATLRCLHAARLRPGGAGARPRTRRAGARPRAGSEAAWRRARRGGGPRAVPAGAGAGAGVRRRLRPDREERRGGGHGAAGSGRRGIRPGDRRGGEGSVGRGGTR